MSAEMSGKHLHFIGIGGSSMSGLARFMLSSEAGAVPLPMDAEALEAVGDEIARRRMGAMQP